MRELFTNAKVFTLTGIRTQDVMLDGSRLRTIDTSSPDKITDLEGLYIFPGFADVHVHFREPGFSHKETIRTGSYAAARGGYSAVCTMPNLKPAPSTLPALQQELDIIARDSIVQVYPVGAITMNASGRGELSDIESIAPYVCAFSDDGKGIQDEDLMREVMTRINKAGKFITAHCEVESELKLGGCIHDGDYARLHGHVGINSASEYKEVERNIRLAEETGSHIHICHVSTQESVNLIREGKRRGVRVTAETAPHYLIFTDMNLEESGRWKMNPPIRSEYDRLALIEGIQDGTIDCLITDHAPHTQDEKSRGLDGSAFGIVGLETCFPAMYSRLVLGERVITLERLLELMCVNPRRIFSLPGPQYIEDNCTADFVIMNLGRVYEIDSSSFLSMGRSTPFDGMTVQGETVATYINGRRVYDREQGIIDA